MTLPSIPTIPNNTSEEPAAKVGTFTALGTGIVALLTYFAPNLLNEKTTTLVLVIVAFVLPIVTAFFIRNKVWSPASVQELIDRAVYDATEELKERLETQRKISEKKFDTEDK